MNRTHFILFCAATFLLAPCTRAVTVGAPAAGATFAPRATFTARVAPSAGEQITAASFGLGTQDPVAGTASATVAGAFEAQITVPPILVGPAFVIASANLADGSMSMDFVQVNVEPGSVDRLILSPIPTLSTVGQVVPLQIKALFADGVTRDVTYPERGTTYATSNDAVLGVHPSGLIQARTKGIAVVTATNRGQTITQVVQVTVPDPPTSHIPIVNPGVDQVVAPETLVTLSGMGSSDPDGNPLTYEWKQQGGRMVLLVTPIAAQPQFISPRVDTKDMLEFSLIVSNSMGASTFPAIVRVTVDPAVPKAP